MNHINQLVDILNAISSELMSRLWRERVTVMFVSKLLNSVNFVGKRLFYFLVSKNKKVPLALAPESGSMLGGTMVYVSGPCFEHHVPVFCRFDTVVVKAHVIDRNRAMCVQPMMFAQGYINLTVSVGPDSFITHGVYYIGMENLINI